MIERWYVTHSRFIFCCLHDATVPSLVSVRWLQVAISHSSCNLQGYWRGLADWLIRHRALRFSGYCLAHGAAQALWFWISCNFCLFTNYTHTRSPRSAKTRRETSSARWRLESRWETASYRKSARVFDVVFAIDLRGPPGGP